MWVFESLLMFIMTLQAENAASFSLIRPVNTFPVKMTSKDKCSMKHIVGSTV